MELKVRAVRADGTAEQVTLCFESCVAIGYAGRNQESVRRHVEELERLGVPRPSSIPSMYWVSPEQVMCAERIQVVGNETSAEVEFFMAPDAEGKLYLTVVSDHSDRRLESVSVSKAKQICPKIIGSEFWVLDDVREHWDDLRLICRARQGDVTPYQDAPVGSQLNWSELLELARADAPCAGPVAFCSGTVPVEDGNIRYADAWDIRLEDPVMGRAIEHRYEVIRLEDRN